MHQNWKKNQTTTGQKSGWILDKNWTRTGLRLSQNWTKTGPKLERDKNGFKLDLRWTVSWINLD